MAKISKKTAENCGYRTTRGAQTTKKTVERGGKGEKAQPRVGKSHDEKPTGRTQEKKKAVVGEKATKGREREKKTREVPGQTDFSLHTARKNREMGIKGRKRK